MQLEFKVVELNGRSKRTLLARCSSYKVAHILAHQLPSKSRVEVDGPLSRHKNKCYCACNK